MAQNPTISRVKLPSGNVYDIKDATARAAIASLEGGSYFLGVATTELSDGATTNPITISTVIDNQPATKSVTAVNGNIAIFGNKEFIYDGNQWCEFGDLSTLGDLATLDSIETTSSPVLGSGTTFATAPSAVTFSGAEHDAVLGANTTFNVTQPTVNVNATTKYIGATASGTAVGGTGTAAAITGFGTHVTGNALSTNATFNTSVTPSRKYVSAVASNIQVSTTPGTFVTGYPNTTTDTFVKSVSAETNKNLVTTSITGCAADTATVSYVTSSASKLETTSVPNVTSPGSASTWAFEMGTGENAETLIISGVNSVAPTLGTAITAATGSVAANGTGSSIVTSVTATDNVVAKKAASPTTVATGATAEGAAGAAVVTGVTIGSSASAITGLGTPSSDSAITAASVTQPTISLSLGENSGEGKVELVDGITSASTTIATDSPIAAITALGTPVTEDVLTGVQITRQPTIALSAADESATGKTGVLTNVSATASGAAVSANNNDSVSAVTTVGTATAAAQTITITEDTVNALTSATAVSNNP